MHAFLSFQVDDDKKPREHARNLQTLRLKLVGSEDDMTADDIKMMLRQHFSDFLSDLIFLYASDC